MLNILLCLAFASAAMGAGVADSLCLQKAVKAFSRENFGEALSLVSGCGQNQGTLRITGLSYLGLYQADSAAFYLAQAAEGPEADDSVILGYSESLLWKKDFKAALGVLRRTTDKKNAHYKRIAALYLEMIGAFPEAVALYDTLFMMDKKPWNTLLRKAQVLSWMKRFPEAVDLFSKVLTYPAAPNAVKMSAVIRRAEVRAWQKETMRALQELDSLIVANNKTASKSTEFARLLEAFQLKGRFLEWEARFQEAKEAYKNILLKQPENKQAQLSLENLLWVK